MSPPLWVAEAAEAFWIAAGEPEPFPRNLRRAIARSLPVTMVLLPRLSVSAAEAWLRQQGARFDVDVGDRPLRACLICRFGHGLIFTDGADTDDEQRYSLAHELAHFLVDYLAPRRAAVARRGEAILDVLDGVRPAGTDERIIGVLVDVPVRPHIHLMERFDDLGRLEEIHRAESAADALANELLAPWDIVSRNVRDLAITGDQATISRLLVERFGLPAIPAQRYAAMLSPGPAPTTALLRHLRRVELTDSGRNIS